MFDNIGRKIKSMAKGLFWGCMVVCSVGGLFGIVAVETAEERIAILIAAIAYGILSWIGSWLMYGFGQLVENSTIMTEMRTDDVLEAFEEEYQRRKRENDI